MGSVMMSGVAPQMNVPISGILASDLSVGSSVYLMEDGVAAEYLVVNQGIPSGSSLYDASCDGMWLLRKDIITTMAWDADNSNVLETSDVQAWLNGDMLAKFDSVTQNAIKQVKIPYRSGGGPSGTDQSGTNGMPCKLFLLSIYEVGLDNTIVSYATVDGAKLDYFEYALGTSAVNKRIAYLNGNAIIWWLRSISTYKGSLVFYIGQNGGDNGNGASADYGIRPALVLPSTAIFDKTTMLLKGVA